MISLEGRIVIAGLDGCVYANNQSNSSYPRRDKKLGETKPAVPISCLSTSCRVSELLMFVIFLSRLGPEVVLGASSTENSMVFIAAIVCMHLLLGKSLIKVGKFYRRPHGSGFHQSGNSIEKYVQFMFRLLGWLQTSFHFMTLISIFMKGTPLTTGFDMFRQLPLAHIYGSQIKV
jgi:hypothetical protein